MTQMRTPLDAAQSNQSAAPRILIADDDASIRYLLETTLESEGYKVLSAADGTSLVQMAQEHVPDLLLIDLMMPHLDGFEAIRQLRQDTRTGHLPMLIVTARSLTDDLVQGFRSGADDFIVKPFNIAELLARIQANLQRAARQPVNNTLTGLPGNMLLVNHLTYRLNHDTPFALLYCDLDNFKVFNDTYGFARGDAAICMVAALLQEAVDRYGSSGDFVGHIGGDDFALLTRPADIEAICTCIVELFDQRVRTFYEQEDLQRGYVSGLDRHGVLRRFPLMSLSIGVVSTQHRTFASHEEVSRAAAEMKHVAKSRSGSSYALDKRAGQSGTVSHERRGAQGHEIVLISADTTLVNVLRQVLNEQGHRVSVVPTPLTANTLLARTVKPMLIIADAQLGEELNELCTSRAPNQPLLMIAGADEETPLYPSGIDAILHQPFAVDELITYVDLLLATTGKERSKN